MKNLSLENKTFLGLILVLVAIKTFDLVAAPNHIYPGRTAVFTWIEIGLALVLGWLALRMIAKVEIANMWQVDISNRQRFLVPLLVGLGAGVLFMLFDAFAKIGDMSVGYPLSMPFYFYAGITTEIITHVFPLALLVWLFSGVLFKGRWETVVFWVVAVLLALFGVVSMLSAFGNPNIPLRMIEPGWMVVLGVLIFATEMAIMWAFRRGGILAALSGRLSFYLVWHVIWPVLMYA